MSCSGGPGLFEFGAGLWGAVLLGMCLGFGAFGDSLVHGARLFVGVPVQPLAGGPG